MEATWLFVGLWHCGFGRCSSNHSSGFLEEPLYAVPGLEEAARGSHRQGRTLSRNGLRSLCCSGDPPMASGCVGRVLGCFLLQFLPRSLCWCRRSPGITKAALLVVNVEWRLNDVVFCLGRVASDGSCLHCGSGFVV